MEPPLRQNFPRKSFLPKRLSCFPTISITESCKASKSARKRQGRPSRGTPTPLGYGYLTHHLPRKVTHAQISDSATDEQVLTHEMRGKKTQLYNPTLKMFRPQRPQKTYAYLKQTIPAGSDIGRGRSSTLGVVSTLGGIWPSLRPQHEQTPRLAAP